MCADRKRVLSLALVATLLLAAGAATATDTRLRNWAPLADVGNPGSFQAMTPCRLADTRVGLGYTGSYGPPAITAAATRTMNIVTSPCTGVPSGASAVSLNFTAVNTQGLGDIRVYPAGGVIPLVSTLNYTANQTVANAAVVPLGATGITILVDGAGLDLIVDINGYYTNYPNLNKQLFINGSFNGIAAIVGYNYSNSDGSHGVGGYAGGTGIVHGVQGQIGSGAGTDSSAVHGIAAATATITHAVLGESLSTLSSAAAIEGRLGGANWASPNLAASGVRGIATGSTFNTGVIGESTGFGVVGYRVNSTGGVLTRGWLGYNDTDGVYTVNNLTCTGTKNFVEPHPSDPTKVIKYVALEGPEAGTYFRGRGRFEGKTAVITVPEDFRLVTEEEGLTVQITPIGRAAAVGVVSMDLNQIVAESTRDGEFSYLVQGVRKAYRDWQPIQSDNESSYFKPRTADEKLDRTMAVELQKRLVSSGIYHADGTLNMSTAERLGWAAEWREREEKTRAAAATK